MFNINLRKLSSQYGEVSVMFLHGLIIYYKDSIHIKKAQICKKMLGKNKVCKTLYESKKKNFVKKKIPTYLPKLF